MSRSETETVVNIRPSGNDSIASSKKRKNWFIKKKFNEASDEDVYSSFYYLIVFLSILVFVLIILFVVFLSLGLSGKLITYKIFLDTNASNRIEVLPNQQVKRTPHNSNIMQANRTTIKETDGEQYSSCGNTFYSLNIQLAASWNASSNETSNTSSRGRIIGGMDAVAHSQPWLVSLRKVSADGQLRNHVCGGCLIDDVHVLTAAHCVAGLQPNQLAIIAGLNSLNVYSDADVYYISSIVAHEAYSGSSGPFIQNDIALLKLDRQVEKSDRVQTICLPKQDDFLIDSYSIVSGWGNFVDAYGSRLPDNLQTLKLKILNEESICYANGAWDNQNMFCAMNDQDPSSNICFGWAKRKRIQENKRTINEILTKAKCALETFFYSYFKGDSGSPMISNQNAQEKWKVYGISSYVIAERDNFGQSKCLTNKPSYYTRVAKYYDWIQNALQL